MKNIKYLFLGTLFGIILIKAEVVSWFRIQEMFLFDNFHMYGVIGCAVVVGAISIQIIKRLGIKTVDGEDVTLRPKTFNKKGNILGGIFFGIGWAMTGACPGPLFALTGAGYTIMIVAILGATLGTFTYGMLRKYLPH